MNFPTAWDRQRYDKDYYQRHHSLIRRKMAAANIKHRERNRRIVQGYLRAHPCVDCGEPDIAILEFDHVRGDKVLEVSTMSRRGGSIKRLMAEIAKCEVRCANCHRRQTVLRRAASRAAGVGAYKPGTLITLRPKQEEAQEPLFSNEASE